MTAVNDRRRYLKPALVAVLLLAVAALTGVAVFTFQRRGEGEKESVHAQSPAPVLLVTEPASGTSAYAGSYLPVSATAMGFRPVTRLELWLDGRLVETQRSDPPEGVSSLVADFELPVSEGPHMLFARAVDADAAVGQSAPVNIVGVPKPGPGDVFYAVTAAPGETLADIAQSYGSDPAKLQDLNASLGGREPATGELIKVPIPPEDEPPAAPPPAPAPGASSVPVPDVPALGVGSTSSLATQAATLPVAPDGLQAQVKDCKVTLVWNDNATDEGGYTVWMAGQGLPPETVGALEASPSTGPAWFEFQAPGPGYFSFWVEAANSVGAQPSNVVWVQVDPACPATEGAQLQVEAVDMTVAAGYDRVYCYVSIEGAPEVRIPEDDSTFMQVQTGQADMTRWRKLALPTPEDNSLDLEGECWGWSGEALSKMGNFSGNLSSETWDGAAQTLDGGPFQIAVAAEPLSAADTREIAADRSPGLPPGGGSSDTFFVEYTEDPALPVPHDLNMGPPPDSPWFQDCVPECGRLSWKWDGDQAKINGFMIFLDGVPYATFPIPAMRDVVVKYPMSACSDGAHWRVAAVAGSTTSKVSDPLWVTTSLVCNIYVKVKFDYLDLEWTHDGLGSGGPGDCDTLDAYYALNMQVGSDNKTVMFYGPSKPYTGAAFRPLRCGVHSFQELADSVDPIYVSGATGPPFSEIHGAIIQSMFGGSFQVAVRANFVDHDDWTGDDFIARYALRLDFGSQKEGLDYLKCGKTFVDSNQDEEGKSHLQFTLTASTSPTFNPPLGCP